MSACTVSDPMLCQLVSTLPEGPEWSYEIKWDGYRVIGTKRPEGLSLISRNSKSLTATFHDITQSLDDLRCSTATIDGEVVALDENGRPSFQLLQNHRSSPLDLRFMVFDALEIDGEDLTCRPLEYRRELLKRILPRHHSGSRLALSASLQGTPSELMAEAQDAELEGIIAKRKDSVYELGERSGAWVKWKAEREQVFAVGGYVASGGSFDALLVGRKTHGQFEHVASVRSGFSPLIRQKILNRILPLTTSECPFANLSEPAPGNFVCHWVEPQLMVRIAFVEWSDDQHLEHARFVSTA
ncbi:MAG: non-homologous end-joining DNA ligase [Verrucomicrobium sp.]